MIPLAPISLHGSWLQRGRARESAEIASRQHHVTLAWHASTGPRSGERGDKVHPLIASTLTARGFNGAALGRARRCRGWARTGEAPDVASTGPRSGERGDAQGKGANDERLHRFNGAALGRARRSPGPSAHHRPQPLGASTGPRSGERGDFHVDVTNSLARIASTGPRSGERGDTFRVAVFNSPMSCFNGAALGRARRFSIPRVKDRSGREASTGPRSGERGDSTRPENSPGRNASLQRGRARESAEIR